MINTVHAVLTGSTLLISKFNRAVRTVNLLSPCSSLPDLHTVALSHGVTHIWIMPGEEEAIEDMDCGEPYNLFCTYEDEEKKSPLFSRIYKKGTYGMVKIGFAGRGDWGWEIDKPVDILATICYLEEVLDVPVEWSPGHIGTELVSHLNRTARRQDWVRETQIDLNALPGNPFKHNAGDLKWKSELTANFMVGMYLHQYDKRSGYLSACPGAYVGAGDPVHVVGGDIDTSLPGIYRVSLDKRESMFDDVFLPPVATSEWVTHDILNYAKSQGYGVLVHECHQWTEKHKTLESYAKKLWTSRRVFRDGADRFPHQLGRYNAENTMKAIALVATGKFGSRKTTRFLRPDWWAIIVDKMRENVLRNIAKYAALGYTPALIYSDAVYYISEDSNPRTAIPGIMDRENELGGYRCESTWKVTPELLEAFRTSKNAGAMQKILKHTPVVDEDEVKVNG